MNLKTDDKKIRYAITGFVLAASSSLIAPLAFAERILEISELSVEPAATVPGSRYQLYVRIKSKSETKPSVTQLRQLRDRMETIFVPINDDGKFSDKVANDGIYSGTSEVPLTAGPGQHKFIVHVQDEQGNRSNALTYTFIVQEAT